ncbi:hypothetical protein OPS25_07430 [Alteromonas ponticola]|uniref:DUF8198 domain-containing protein n=1 Tax=Alteromonas aquimaris TaxID=2998417 RepID=A0ABT3P6C2_9ALTE|nr:hypothetical protein [Alteromonas aquimaris]MCW8108323.1 hypothetical protein [Alteromonas aquimaris]
MNQTVQPLIQHLHRLNAKRELVERMGQLDNIHQLQAWQCERLLASHQDLAQQKRYQDAMSFFVDELYGPKDFSQRDADIARVIPKLAKVLPDKAMLALEDAIALNALSFDLDLEVTEALEGQEINRDTYAVAYRKVGRQADRQKQLDLIYDLGMQLNDVIKIKGIGMLIKFARRPAKIAGLLTLHEFLERGFNAFKVIGDVHGFVDPVITREKELMETLLSPDTDLTQHNPLPHVKI